jgi:ATP-dependent Lon protease
MIADCTPAREGQDYGLFGMSFEHEGTISSVGCAVQVLKVTRRYSNGTFDIVCRGAWRYRLTETLQERAYLTARVERLDDEDAGLVNPSLRLLVQERLQQLMDLASQDMGGLGYGPQADDLESLQEITDVDAFELAQRIGVEPVRRQQLLELLGEGERLQFLAGYLEEMLPTMQERQERQRRVKTNGHTLPGNGHTLPE